MANTIAYTDVRLDYGIILVTWANMQNGDTGIAYGAINSPAVAGYTDRSVQVTGTLGAAGTVVIEGANSTAASPTFATMSDPQGNALSLNALGMKQILEAAAQIRPRVTGGDGTTSLTISIIMCAHTGKAGTY